jgi:hypothetical protein
LQRRLHDLNGSPKARRALTHRSMFREALTWLDVHAGSPEVVADWKALAAGHRDAEPSAADRAGNVASTTGAATGGDAGDAGDVGDRGPDGEAAPFKRKRRRRRRRFRPAPTEQ